ncbi:thiolase family protein [Curtobacterium sp. 22159]|uniref:thiolase family protein n=1 Tax=Curtobacterium sp. 22159 TaxID=3453882 RepID=UPI003F84ED2D
MDAFIIDAVRTPFAKGKVGGAYSDAHPVELHAHVLRSLIARTGVDPEAVDDVISGVVGQIGEQSANSARWAALAAGLPPSVPAVTIDRQCGSGQQAVHFGAQGIQAGAYDLVIASGVESMSSVPIGSQLAGRNPFGTTAPAKYPLVPQGISADLIANRWGISRERSDAFAVRSHTRAAAAFGDGRLASQLVPLPGEKPLLVDESVRPGTTPDALAALQPAFRTDQWAARFPDLEWTVTAGNSSPVNDGAAAVLLASEDAVRRFGLTPRARVHAMAVVGDDPTLMLTGIVPATRRVLERAGLGVHDMDAFEVNEAFSSVVLAWLDEIHADPELVNVDGGALAFGHPLGASGGRLLGSLLGVLDRTGGRFGLQTICEAGGLANAMVIERL